MRLRIRHEASVLFDPPAKFSIQTLRMTPRGHEGQHVTRWRIDVDADCRLRGSEDSFGNVTHTFTVDGPLERLGVVAEGEIETFDNAGVVRGGIERFPAELYLRETDLTLASRDLRDFALACTKDGEGPLDNMHRLMDTLHERLRIDPEAGHAPVAAAEAFAGDTVGAANVSHVLVAAARFVGIPARVVEGYYLAPEDAAGSGAHSWAEAHVEGLGWIGFDAAHGLCPQESHLRVAIGLDRLAAAPIRIAQSGGLTPPIESRISIRRAPQAGGASQSQSQSQS